MKNSDMQVHAKTCNDFCRKEKQVGLKVVSGYRIGISLTFADFGISVGNPVAGAIVDIP